MQGEQAGVASWLRLAQHPHSPASYFHLPLPGRYQLPRDLSRLPLLWGAQLAHVQYCAAGPRQFHFILL